MAESNFLSFIDIKFRRVSNSFSTSIHGKVAFSGVFTNFESFISVSCKSNLIFTLLYRAFKLCSNFVVPFHQENLNLKDIFKRNVHSTLFRFKDTLDKKIRSDLFLSFFV